MHGAGLLLVSAAAGYWVLERAEGHKAGMLRGVGRFVGWLVILVSIGGAVCQLSCGWNGRGGMMKGGMCPWTRSAPGPMTPAPR